jgi:hypothetical protein
MFLNQRMSSPKWKLKQSAGHGRVTDCNHATLRGGAVAVRKKKYSLLECSTKVERARVRDASKRPCSLLLAAVVVMMRLQQLHPSFVI